MATVVVAEIKVWQRAADRRSAVTLDWDKHEGYRVHLTVGSAPYATRKYGAHKDRAVRSFNREANRLVRDHA